ncbi:MAG: class I SAM-dependent methyltransferase, partial [Planctomycetaceae bacterium]|nr:class I SAM-dependent methyltransferase [Planctomycetaceae bacterium]
AFLANKYPTANITAVDISGKMLSRAKATLGDVTRVQFVQGDMLRYLESQPGQSCDLVFSAWAIGYSVPAKIIAESYRVLRPGGTLAVIVNRLSTMPAVFAAFRKTMRAFPASLEKALWPHSRYFGQPCFPRSAGEIKSYLNRHAFRVELLEEGIAPITPPDQTNNSTDDQAGSQPSKRLDWLLGTGVLAGFDSVLPLQPRPEIDGSDSATEMRRFFERELDAATNGWEHHYVMFMARNAWSDTEMLE